MTEQARHRQIELTDPPHTPQGVYDIVPSWHLAGGMIRAGYKAIALVIAEAVERGACLIAIESYHGVLWDEFSSELQNALLSLELRFKWLDTHRALLSGKELAARIGASIGGDDPLFGKLYTGDLSDFFDLEKLRTMAGGSVVIIAGPGAALVADPDLLVYADVPKDEIQRRMRAGLATNLVASECENFGLMYKRAYFVEWPALNRHKARLLPRIDWFVDTQSPGCPTIISGSQLRSALEEMAGNYFRVRPWFFPGPWGGQWMKEHFPGLDQDAPNYAWSFELIVPENGLVFESSGERLECSFDLLMFRSHHEVLGKHAGRFGYDFPLRFDYLDTFDGGNLSVQCHPRPEYIREHFGEPFTQDESYYIVDCAPEARVNLGFTNEADPDEFRDVVERSRASGEAIDVGRYVNSVESHKHNLFLIPNGTIHGSGINNLVLEISATPYIYTFKIYDWVRRDLEGKLRPLNIERAWENLYFERRERYVRDFLCPQPRIIREGPGWCELFLGTHEAIFYSVNRYDFDSPLEISTEGRCHVMNLVEGEAVLLETARGRCTRINFGETFVVPAAAESYRLTSLSPGGCKVVKAFVK